MAHIKLRRWEWRFARKYFEGPYRPPEEFGGLGRLRFHLWWAHGIPARMTAGLSWGHPRGNEVGLLSVHGVSHGFLDHETGCAFLDQEKSPRRACDCERNPHAARLALEE